MFLLANIFTGLTNVIINTKAQSDLVAHFVLIVYMVSMVSVGYAIAANETVRIMLTGHYNVKSVSENKKQN